MNQNILKMQNKNNLQSCCKKFFILLIVCVFSLFVSQTLYASADEPDGESPAWENWEESDEITSIGKTVFGWAYDVYSGEAIISDSLLSDLNINFNSGEYAPVWNAIEFVYDIVATTGMLLLILYWLLDLLEKVQMDSFTLEHFVRASIKLVIGILLMSNGLNLLIGLLGLANAIFADLGSGSEAAGAAAANGLLTEIWEECLYQKDHVIMGTFPLLGRLVQLIIPALAMMLIRIVIYVVVYGRIIELFVRTAFAPIGMANIYTGGMNSSGFRYIKKIAAVALTGCVIFVVLSAYSALSAIINDPANVISAGTGPIKQLVLGFTAVTLIIKAQSWSNDIVGV